MCRKAFRVLVLAILSAFITTSAVAQPIVIEDFESYQWPTPPLYPWQDISPGPSSADLTILVGDAPQGGIAGQFNFDIAGGWKYPDDPTNYESWDNAGMQREIPPPLDFQPGGEIHMYIKLEPDWDIINTDFFVIEYGGDQWGQTLLPGPGATWIMYAIPPETIPAWIGPDSWSPPGWQPDMLPEWIPPNPVPVISPDDGWIEIVIDENMWMSWGAPLVDFDAMSSISLQLWGSGDLLHIEPKIDGTDTIWPPGPLNGTIDIDYIYYVPEPATIALLALGALAVIRSKQSRKSS